MGLMSYGPSLIAEDVSRAWAMGSNRILIRTGDNTLLFRNRPVLPAAVFVSLLQSHSTDGHLLLSSIGGISGAVNQAVR